MSKSAEDYIKELREKRDKSIKERNFAIVGLILTIILAILYILL
jgi:hypothetical protein